MAPVAAARAQGVEGTRSATIFVGTGVSLAGNAINEAVGTIDGKPSVFVEQALSNHFSDALRLRFTGSMGLDYNKEAFATLAYGKYNGTDRIVGSVSGYPLVARLSNGDAFDIEGGLRYYLRPEGPIRTYVAGALGLRFLQATNATFRVPEVGLTLDNQPYFKGSTLLIFGGDTGVSYDVSDTMALGMSSGFGTRASRAPNRSLRIRISRASTTRAAAGRFRSAPSWRCGSDAGARRPSADRSASSQGCDGACAAARRHHSSRWP